MESLRTATGIRNTKYEIRILYPYPLSRQKTGIFKVDLSPSVKAVGTEGARAALAAVFDFYNAFFAGFVLSLR